MIRKSQVMGWVGKLLPASRSKAQHRTAGDRARNIKDWLTAIKHYQIYLERHPYDFGIFVQLGHAFKETGRYDQAFEAYNQALGINSEDADLYLQLGHLEKMRSNINSAIKMYAKSLELDGNENAQKELSALTSTEEGGFGKRKRAHQFAFAIDARSRELGLERQQNLICMKIDTSKSLLAK